MPEPLTHQYLKEIQARIAAAPMGPWDVEPSEHGVPDQVGPIAYLQTWADNEQLPTVEFIGHARTDLPALLGEVSRLATEAEALRAEVAAARRFAEDMRGYCSPHNVSAMYAERLVDAMDRARLPERSKAGAPRGR
ncbi:hypothetical protein SCAB_60471 [Streptomyces scabiei 87.22]|uniref:Uncharacterized protein n=1 Tax=Streptomyces scabiei (strain 87.22) TaxID=680198 RepID=C9Z8X7_STRSW|nr:MULTISPECIES: hypothetical protein [Streptomyces]MBP5875724.1 hypothetical protein [Streptomyces sp. LBUM 1477]MDX2652182.1 hypothetical protein [Streptomyces scabiei]MDX2725792.1 hypothetical protein [Streptomyces scabiei]MDX2863911.1 hypothetical protein [Streptomyces scabiei]MDX2881835.1 hypothetical protein [Streptomyces scabiei]